MGFGLYVCLAIQHAKCMEHTVLSSVACTTVCPHHLISGTICRRWLLNIKCVLIACRILSETFLFLEEFIEMLSKMCIGLHVQYRLFLSDFNETWIFSRDLRKILKHQTSWKFFQRQPSCSRRTQRHDKTYGFFLQFCESVRKLNMCVTTFSLVSVINIISFVRTDLLCTSYRKGL